MSDSTFHPEGYYLNAEEALDAAKQLQSQQEKQPVTWEPIRSSPCTVLFAVLCFTLAAWGSAQTSEWLSGPSPLINECDNSGNISLAERQFQINIRAAKDLSFAQAKIIDLFWDLGVAQGGRLLHGWILYHIACKTITWALEHASLPCDFSLRLLFWPDSIWSLFSSINYLVVKRQRGLLVPMVLLTYCIAHVLLFGTLWSAATGYQSIGKAAFAMPDGSWVASEHDALRFCWSLDPKRLAPLPADGVVLGPRFGSVFQSFSDLNAESGTGRMWDSYHNIAGDVSDDFNNIYSYARSRFTMQTFVRNYTPVFQESLPGGENLTEVVEWNKSMNGSFSDFDQKGFQDLTYSSKTSKQPSEGKLELPRVVNGWQFLGLRQSVSTSPKELVSVAYQDQEHGHYNTGRFLKANFRLDASVPSGPEVIPYNSTVWYNETKIALDAPFLDVGFKNCSWSLPLLGECICYKGKPLTEDFRHDVNKLCIGGDQYIWGFSRSLIFVGLFLETVWGFFCLILLLLSTQQSQLVRHGRPTVGIIRTVLDLSEALNRALGPDTSWHTEKQLEKELCGHQPVGYTIWDKGDVTGHIGLAPLAEAGTAKRSLRVDDFKTG